MRPVQITLIPDNKLIRSIISLKNYPNTTDCDKVKKEI